MILDFCSRRALSLWSGAVAVGFCHGCFLFGNARTLRSHLGIQVLVGRPFRWQVVGMENRSDRAFWNTRFAVDAFFRIDEQNGFTFVEALDWTDDHAVSVFAVEAWFGYDMSHRKTLSRQKSWTLINGPLAGLLNSNEDVRCPAMFYDILFGNFQIGPKSNFTRKKLRRSLCLKRPLGPPGRARRKDLLSDEKPGSQQMRPAMFQQRNRDFPWANLPAVRSGHEKEGKTSGSCAFDPANPRESP